MAEREKSISAVTLWGAAANILLSVVKLLAGFAGHSAAMLADALHSLSDLVSDIVVLVAVRISSKGRDKSHDYGHGKFETLATAVVAVMLIVVGAKLLSEGVGKIVSVIHGEVLPVPGMIAFWAAIISILVKELLYQWTAFVGRKHDSQVVIANAWHHRTDALSSVGAALGIGLAVLLGGTWAVLDPVVCCGISIFIFYVAVKMALPALLELTEASLSDEVENEISGLISAVEGVEGVHALKTRRVGPDIIIDAHMVVNPAMSVAEAHHLTVLAENSLRRRFGEGTQISLHVEPSQESE